MSLLTDLVECFELGEASGDTVGAHASTVMVEANNPGTATGKVGNCRDLESSSGQFFSIADNALFSLGADTAFMVGAWVRLESKTTVMVIFSKWISGTNQREYLLDYESTADRFRFGVSNNGTASTLILANNFGSPSLATWYYVLGWYDPALDKVFISVNNGTPNEAAHTTGTFSSGTSSTWIGAANFSGTPGSCWDGLIDQLVFYKGGFPDSAGRTALYNSDAGMSYAAMVAYGGAAFKSAWARGSNQLIQVA